MTSPKYERIFDGKKFIFAMVFVSKSDAQKGKEMLKKRGFKA